MNIKDLNVREMIDKSYNAGYKDAKKKACKWLMENAHLYVYATTAEKRALLFNEFKRIMKNK